jgi:hypothetical protein
MSAHVLIVCSEALGFESGISPYNLLAERTGDTAK